MKLTELNPVFITMPVQEEHWTFQATEDGPDGAGGIRFDCPQCRLHPENDPWHVNSNGERRHRLTLYVPDAFDGDPNIGPGRWSLVGDSFENLSLDGGSSSSVLCEYGCRAHFFVKDGHIEMCDDSGGTTDD